MALVAQMLDTSIHRKSNYQGDKYSTETTCIHWVELYSANSVKHLQINGPWLCTLMYSLHLYLTETSVFKISKLTILKLLIIFTSLTRLAELLSFTDTPLIRTAAESPTKLDI